MIPHDRSLLYIANLRLPTEKAYGIQIAKMCEAFADEDWRVRLIAPYRYNPGIADHFHDYYSVKRNFDFHIVWAPHLALGKYEVAEAGIKNTLSAIILAWHALWQYSTAILSRDELPLYLLSFFRSNLIWEIHKFSPARKFFYKRFRKINLKIIAISQGLKNDLVASGFDPQNILVAADGVDLKDFDITISQADARKQLGLPVEGKIVMYTGHLFDWKGADVLAQAAAQLPRALIVFVGGTEEDVERFKQAYGEASNILIVGRKPHREIPLYLKAADALVLPNRAQERISSTYTSPLKLFEYMAAGRTIVASDLPSIREILNERNAILVPSDSPVGLAQGINQALAQADDHLAQQAHTDVHQHGWRQRAAMILAFISRTR